MKKVDDKWITASQAREIISANSGHEVQEDYVRLIARAKPHVLRHKPKNGRVNLYFKPDVEKIVVKPKKTASKLELPSEAFKPLGDAA